MGFQINFFSFVVI